MNAPIRYTAIVTIFTGITQQTVELECTGGEWHGHNMHRWIKALAGFDPRNTVSHGGYNDVWTAEEPKNHRFLIATLHQTT